MNTSEIWSALRSHPLLCKYAIGVFASDQIPTKSKRNICFIANTQPITEPGQHWIAFFCDNENRCDFFDSYGTNPTLHFKKFLKTAKSVKKNTRQIQSNLSTCCGQYCLFYLTLRCEKKSHEEILRLFSSNLHENDKFVTKWANIYFKLNEPVIDFEYIVNQISTNI